MSLHELHWRGSNSEWIFQSRGDFAASSIKHATFLVAVSLRNPAFSNYWLREVFDSITHFRGQAVLCLVDTPYISSIQALTKSREELLNRLNALRKERKEHLQRLERISLEYAERVTLFDWSDLIALTPKQFDSEIAEAFSKEKKTTELVLKQVRRAFPDETDNQVLSFLARFFLEEVPVLCHIYYHLFPGCIDVYPGPQADFFWHLEDGTLGDELPRLTSLASSATAHRYALVRMNAGPNDV